MTDRPITLPDGWRLAGGDTAALARKKDWSATPLGSRDTWSDALRLAVDIVMASAFPMALRWGPHFVLIYNDRYRPILGDKHPWAFGRPAAEAWAEVWAQLEPGHQAILAGRGEGVFAEDLPLRVQRHAGAWEDARFTLSYSPVPDASAPSGVGGILVTAVETTGRVRAEQALQESQSYLQDILRSSGEAFYAVDRDGATTLCNQAFLRLLGFEREEDAVGRKLHAVIHHSYPGGAHYDVAECPIYRTASTGEPCHVEDEVFFRLSGEPVPVEYWARPIHRNGVHEGAICTFIDISERRAAQEALAASEAQFRTFAQAMPNHVWTSPPDGQLDWFNNRTYEFSGMPQGSLDGEGWVGIVHPADVDAAGRAWVAALTTGADYETEFRLRRADGVWRWHLARAVAIRSSDGEIARWIGTNTDIEEQKASEKALADLNATLAERVAEQAAERDRLWQTSQDLLAVLDSRGVFLSVNPAWSAILGWSAEELIGRDHRGLVHPEDYAAEQTAADRPRPMPTHLNRVLCKSGDHRWISWIASSEGDRVYATGRDIHREKEAAEKLALAQEALRQSQKMEAVGQLTGGIAHDFNNMLAVVIGSLDLLGRRLGDDERSRRYVDAAADGARRAANLTQRLLAFSRQQPLEPKPTDLNKLVSGMSDLLRHSIGAEVRFETVLAGGLWPVNVDANQLENVILNLVVNARDAMPGGGRLTIETQNAHLDDRYAAAHVDVAAGQYVMIAVTDTGGGMPPEVIEKAFDPFFTTKAVGKGTGLGLSQVYGFIKQSGGHVKIYSEPGIGTAVKIYLGRLNARIAANPVDRSASAQAMASGETILVVEDEPGVRAFTTEALSELGYTVLTANSGEAALRLLDTHPEIALLFTDVVMPEMNGRKLADEVRARRPALKVLFTTGYTRNAVVHNGVLDPGVAMIGKPFTVDELAEKVRGVLIGT